MSQITNLSAARAKILKYPDPVLRQKSRPVPTDDEPTMLLVRQCVGALLTTMKAAAGWGLAAIQIGVPIRVFVVHVPQETPNPLVFVNATIVAYGYEEVQLPEGCLSFETGRREPITRPSSVIVRRHDQFGRIDTSTFKGWTARVIQHEMEHLDGILLADKLLPAARRMLDRQIKRRAEKKQPKSPQPTEPEPERVA